MVHEIANVYAMRAERWATTEAERRQMLSREVVEAEIRLFDVDEWAATLGHPLRLQLPGDVWEAVPSEWWSGWGDATSEWSHDLPAAFSPGRAPTGAG